MKSYIAFVLLGSLLATIEEFLTIVVLRQDWGAYGFTLLVLFPVFLTVVYFGSGFLDRLFRREVSRQIAHFVVFGCVGLAIEWFLIGLSPWSNPEANPWLMLAFQLGMFSFWATVAFAPRMILRPTDSKSGIGRKFLTVYVAYFALVYLIALTTPPVSRFNVVIPLVVLGYLSLNAVYAVNFYLVAAEKSHAQA